MRKTLPILILLLALLLCACGRQTGETYSLTLWYVEGDPLAPALLRLTEDYNRERGRDTLAVTARAWADDEKLQRTLQAGVRPALILCTHELAFSLSDAGELRDLGLSLFSFPAWFRERSACVGRSFFPLGSEVDLLCTRGAEPESLPDLLAEAAARGERNGEPFLSVERFAPLFFQVLRDAGAEFSAQADRDALSEDYVNFYNAVAEAAFTHGLTADGSAGASCRIESSTSLASRELKGFRLYPLSDGPLLASCRGLAVTVRDTRMQRALPDFLRWLAASGRLGEAALKAGLIPAAEEPLSADTPLEAALVSLTRRSLVLPAAESEYYVNHSDFEKQLRAALELLH